MLSIVITLIGGLGLFIAGMNLMSQGIELAAGDKLRAILKAFTKNRFLGLIVGTFFTAVIQSSSAATVMTVSFVNSGLMTLSEACGIILGANIGTTVTSLLVAFKLSTVAPFFALTGAVMVNFIKNPMAKKIGQVILGFGILFMGISIMSGSMAEMREIPAVMDFFANFTNPILGILLGLVITSVVQSSSVTVSILVVMASQGLVDLHICMFVILGCNIGACTSAVLTSLAGSKNAKRTALIHLLFNVFGTVLMFVLLLFFSNQIANIICMVSGNGNSAANLGRNIAIAHFLFKVFQVIVLYPFMNLIIKMTYVLVRGNDVKPEGYRLKFIGNAIQEPTMAMPNALHEIQRMAKMALLNMNDAVKAFITGDNSKLELIKEAEGYVDYLDEQISAYLVKMNRSELPLDDANQIASYFHAVNGIERVGDHADSIAKLIPRAKDAGVVLSEESKAEIKEMLGALNALWDLSMNILGKGTFEDIMAVSDLEREIDEMEIKYEETHIERLKEGKCSAEAGIYFSDIVSVLEQSADHAVSIVYSLAETKAGMKKHGYKLSAKTEEA
ncbi:MAG: Na/Pi cotransporter family protein [Clostridia bacterium]|nr:Na/Pi cotransporter family protein [Clostridia bacterium]